MLWKIDKRIAYSKQFAENNKASFNYKKAPIKEPIVKTTRIGALTLGLFFQNSGAEKSSKIPNPEDKSFHYIEFSMQSEKVGKTFIKKSWKEKKEQYRY